MVSIFFENLANNISLLNTSRSIAFSYAWYGVRFCHLTLLTVLSDRIATAFNRSGATRAAALDVSKTFDRVWRGGLLLKLKFYGISGWFFKPILYFLPKEAFKWFWMVNVQKNHI